MSDMEQVRELAKQLYEFRQEKTQHEERIKQINAEIKGIEESKLSSLLDELGISKVSLEDMDISKSLVFRGGYTKHSDPEAFQFLFDSQNDGALKQQVIVDLGAYPQVKEVLDALEMEYKVEYSIHHMTLSSIIKELVESGKFTTEDIDKYSVYVQPQVSIKKKNRRTGT